MNECDSDEMCLVKIEAVGSGALGEILKTNFGELQKYRLFTRLGGTVVRFTGLNASFFRWQTYGFTVELLFTVEIRTESIAIRYPCCSRPINRPAEIRVETIVSRLFVNEKQKKKSFCSRPSGHNIPVIPMPIRFFVYMRYPCIECRGSTRGRIEQKIVLDEDSATVGDAFSSEFYLDRYVPIKCRYYILSSLVTREPVEHVTPIFFSQITE